MQPGRSEALPPDFAALVLTYRAMVAALGRWHPLTRATGHRLMVLAPDWMVRQTAVAIAAALSQSKRIH